MSADARGSAPCSSSSASGLCPECLGRIVRSAWSKAVADIFPNTPQSWKHPWEQVSPEWQEVNIRVGLAVAKHISEKRSP